MDLLHIVTVAGGALFPLLRLRDATTLRAACAEARAVVAAYPWGDTPDWLESTRVNQWRACFPHAKAIRLIVQGGQQDYARAVEFAARVPQLHTLILSVCTDDHAFPLIRVLRCLPRLRRLCITCTGYYCNVSELPEALSVVPQLHSLELQEGMDDARTLALALALTHVPLLRVFHCRVLRAFRVEPSTVLTLARALEHLVHLHTLDVVCNLANALATTTLRLPALRELRLAYCAMGYTAACGLAANLTHMPQLTKLDVSYSDIVSHVLAVVAASLHHVPCLTALHVEGNAIGDAGACALAAGLAHTPQLRTLHLGTSIGDVGMVAIAAALKHLPRLERLDAHYNCFGQVAVRALAAALADAACLISIDLSACDIMDAGACVLAPALARLPRLQSVGLVDSGIGVNGDGIAALRRHLPHIFWWTWFTSVP